MGYIQIDRNISNNWIWQKKPYSYGQAWIDLLLLANYKENKRTKNNQIIISNRGEINLSILYLSNKWGWDRKKTTRFLELLEKDNMIGLNKTKNGTTIRITNYNVYQRNQLDTKQQMGQQMDNKWDNNSPYINKEKKKKNNNIYVDEFEELWEIYPKKEGKTEALKKYIKYRNEGTTYEQVLEGLKRYNEYLKEKGTERQYIKNGSTWFNQKCWEDEYKTKEETKPRIEQIREGVFQF